MDKQVKSRRLHRHKVKPRIVITTGDPRGIGPEVTEKALKDTYIRKSADYLIIKPSDKTGLDAVQKALAVLKLGEADALVTAPVNKAKINSPGKSFTGHTDYLAKATGTEKFAMMFCSDKMRVTLVTRHVRIKDVPGKITREAIRCAILLTVDALKKYFDMPLPRIALCGLNPHCGEGIGASREEKKVIMPAIKSARVKAEISLLPADVAFYKALNKEFDAVISMYHDQGLAPFKMIAFERGVNVTLGLPFIRTSPDHGTAYDIAGKGRADPSSMKEAVKLAISMSMVGLC